jgi:hypothetical protein
MTGASDIDSPSSQIRLSGVTFETAVRGPPESASWVVSSVRGGASPFAGRDWSYNANYLIRCGATLTDGCGDTSVTVPSGAARIVSTLDLVPSVGPAKLQEDLHIVGAGFIAGSANYQCKFSGDGRALNVPGVAVNQSHVRCSSTGKKFYGSAESQSVTLWGPVMEYLGCYSGKDINSVSSLVRVGGSKVRASTCQYLCYAKSTMYDLYLLHGGACFCGKSQQNQVPSSPLNPTSSCTTLCPSLQGVDEYEEIGCFFDQSGDRDLPLDVTSSITGAVDADKCSIACNGYAFFGVQGQPTVKCFCGNSYGRHGTASDCPKDNRNLVFQQTVNLGSTGLKSGYVADSVRQQCGTKADSATPSTPTTLPTGQVTVYRISPTPPEISAGYFEVGASAPGVVSPPVVNDVPGGVSVSWIPPSFLGGASDVDSFTYKILFRCLSPSCSSDSSQKCHCQDKEQLIPTPGALQGTVLALSPSLRYAFRVVARSDPNLGWGDVQTTQSEGEAGEAVPPDPPGILALSTVNSDSVTLTFPPSAYDGGVAIQSYYVKYAMSSDGCETSAEGAGTPEPEPEYGIADANVWYVYKNTDSPPKEVKRIRREGIVKVDVGSLNYDNAGNIQVTVKEPFQKDTTYSSGGVGTSTYAADGLKSEQLYKFQVYSYNLNEMPSFRIPSPALEVSTDAATTPRYVCAPFIQPATQTLVFYDGFEDTYVNGGNFKLTRGTETTDCIAFNGDETCSESQGTWECKYNLAAKSIKEALEKLPSSSNWKVSVAIEGFFEHGDVRAVLTFDPPVASSVPITYSVDAPCDGPKNFQYNCDAHGCTARSNPDNSNANTADPTRCEIQRADCAPIKATFQNADTDGCSNVRLIDTNTCVDDTFDISKIIVSSSGSTAVTTYKTVADRSIVLKVGHVVKISGASDTLLNNQWIITAVSQALAELTISQVVITQGGDSAVATYTTDSSSTFAHTVAVGDLVTISGAAETQLNNVWSVIAVSAGATAGATAKTFTFKSSQHGFKTEGTYSTGSIIGIKVGSDVTFTFAANQYQGTPETIPDGTYSSGTIVGVREGPWTKLASDPSTGATDVPVYKTPPCPNLPAAFTWTAFRDGGKGNGASGQTFKLRPGKHVLTKELHFPVRNMKLLGYGPASSIVVCAPNKRCLVADSAHAHPKDGVTFGSLIKGITFTGGKSSDFGGAILIESSSRPVVFEDVILTKNSAVAGGGIAIMSCTARIDFSSGVVFRENTASHFGGGVLVMASQEVRFSKNMAVSSNVAQFGGGIATVSKQRLTSYLPAGVIPVGTASDSEDNSESGSASIEIRSSIVFSNSTLDENTATSTSEGSGGAIYSYESDVSIIDGATVQKNKATLSGGGCFFQASTVSITASTIQSNDVVSVRGKGGGFSCISSTVKVKVSSLNENKAGQDGGAVSATFCPVTLSEVQVKKNRAISGCGGGLNLELMCEATVKNSNFVGNQGEIYGGGIFAKEVLQIRVSGSTFLQNHAGSQGKDQDEETGGGGGIATASSQNVQIVTSIFNGCLAYGAAGGGALRLDVGNIEVSTLQTSKFRPVVSGCNFTKNTAPAGGGGALKWLASSQAMTDLDTKTDDAVLWTSNGAGGNTAMYGDLIASGPKAIFLADGPAASWDTCGSPFYYEPRAVSYCKPGNQCPTYETRKSQANRRLENGGKKFGVPLRVEVLDYYGRTIKSSRSIVQVKKEKNEETTFSGTVNVVAVKGVAVFEDLTVDEPPTSGTDANEMQILTITESLKTQTIELKNTHLSLNVSEIVVSSTDGSAVATYTKFDSAIAAAPIVGDIVAISGSTRSELNNYWTITAVSAPNAASKTFTFESTEHGFTSGGTYSAGSIVGALSVGSYKNQSVHVTSIDFTKDATNKFHKIVVNHHRTTLSKGQTITISGAADEYFNKPWIIYSVSNQRNSFQVGDGTSLILEDATTTLVSPASGTYNAAGMQVIVNYKYSAAFTLAYFNTHFCVPYVIDGTSFNSLLHQNVGQFISVTDTSVKELGDTTSNSKKYAIEITKVVETLNISNITVFRDVATVSLQKIPMLESNPGLIHAGDSIKIAGINLPSTGSVLNTDKDSDFTVTGVGTDGFTFSYLVTQNGAAPPGNEVYTSSNQATVTVTLINRPIALSVTKSTCDLGNVGGGRRRLNHGVGGVSDVVQNGITAGARGIFSDHDLAPVNDFGAASAIVVAASMKGSFDLGFDYVSDEGGDLECVKMIKSSVSFSVDGGLPTAMELQNSINKMPNVIQDLGSVSVSVNDAVGSAIHNDTGAIYAKSGDTIIISGFYGADSLLSGEWVVTGSPTRYGFNFNATSLRGKVNGTIGIGKASVLSGVDVTRTLHSQPAEGATYAIAFTGKTVNGNMPMLTIDSSSLTGSDGSERCSVIVAAGKPCVTITEKKVGSVPKRITYPASVTAPGTNLPEIPPFGARLRDCIPGEYLQGGFKCTACSPGMFSTIKNSESCTDCESGKAQPYRGRDMCYDCASGAAQLSKGQAGCVSCESGKWTNKLNGKALCEKECPAGSFGEKKFVKIYPYCQLQTASQALLGNGEVCEECPTGWFNPKAGEFCLKQITQEIGDCIACPTGFHSPVTGNIRCLECLPGRYASTESTVDCPLCQAGFDSPKGSTSCTIACAAGKYKTANMTGCDLCPAGRSGAELGKPTIPRKGLGLCDYCDPGRYSTVGLPICNRCVKGKFSPLPGASMTCDTCVGGKYAATLGHITCTSCEPGLFNPILGDSSSTREHQEKSCNVCDRGQATNDQSNATECTACPIGYMGLEVTDLERKPNWHPTQVVEETQLEYPPKKIPNPNSKYATCAPCPKNEFSNKTGVKECQQCPPQTFTRNQTGQSFCEGCWRGEIFPPGTRECIPCKGESSLDRGFYSYVAGDLRASCHECPSGASCAGYDQLSVQWGWWQSKGKDQARELYGTPGKCKKENFKTNDGTPIQCGHPCGSSGLTILGDECIAVPAGEDGKSVAYEIGCIQGRDRGGMYDECGVRRTLMMCDGGEPGVRCEEFMSDIARGSNGFDFKGEGERQNKVNFDLSSGDLDKVDGSKTYLPDGCNACRATTLITNVQIIRFDTTEKNGDAKKHYFRIGFDGFSIVVHTNSTDLELQDALESLPTIEKVKVVIRRSTNPSKIACPQAQANFNDGEGQKCNKLNVIEYNEDGCDKARNAFKSVCNKLDSCFYDDTVKKNQCQIKGHEWLVTFVEYKINKYRAHDVTKTRITNIEFNEKRAPKNMNVNNPMNSSFVYRQHQAKLMYVESIDRAIGEAALSSNVSSVSATEDTYFVHRSVVRTANWVEEKNVMVSILPGTYRRVLCNAENGRNFEMANHKDQGECYDFDIHQEGSRRYVETKNGSYWEPVSQTVRIQQNWNETILHTLEAAAADHPDEDAPSHRCNIAAGYSGRLCQVCLPGFGRSGRYGCKRCSADPVTTGLVSLMGLGAAIGYVSLFVYVVIKDAGSTSTAGSVQKILLNHFQLVSICVNYPLNWPSELLSMFNYFSFLSDISEKVLDLDCALKDPVIFGWTNLEPFFLLQLFYSVIPVLMIIGFCSFWLIKGGVIHCCCGAKHRRRFENVKITLSDVPEELKKKYENRLSHEKLLAKQHMFKYAAKMTTIRNKVKTDITDAVQAAHHKAEREEALHHISGLKRILQSTFKRTAELTGEDRIAVAKMRAREFVHYCRTHHIHLREIWLQYDLNHSGSISYSAFEHIVRSLGFVWTPDEMQLVCELFDGADAKVERGKILDKDGKKGKNSKPKKTGNGRIELHNLVNFGKTTTDKIVSTFFYFLFRCFVFVYCCC